MIDLKFQSIYKYIFICFFAYSDYLYLGNCVSYTHYCSENLCKPFINRTMLINKDLLVY